MNQGETISTCEAIVCFLPKFNEYLMQEHDLPEPEVAREMHGLKSGDQIERQVHRITSQHYQEREWRYGYTGQMVDRAREISREIVSRQVFTLRKRGGVWTWVAA